MANIQRNRKIGGTNTFESEFQLGFDDIRAMEIDADFDTIYNAWNGGIDAGSLVDGSVTGSKIAPDSINSNHIINGSITELDLVDVLQNRLPPAWSPGEANRVLTIDPTGAYLVWATAPPPFGAASGDLTGSYPNPIVAKASGGLTVPISNAIKWGAGPVLGRLIQGNTSKRAEFTYNMDDLGAQDDIALPSWRVRLGGTTDDIQFNRQAPGPGAVTSMAVLRSNGRLTLGADPTAALDAATKQYVDAQSAMGASLVFTNTGQVGTLFASQTNETNLVSRTITTNGGPILIFAEFTGFWTINTAQAFNSTWEWYIRRDTTLTGTIIRNVSSKLLWPGISGGNTTYLPIRMASMILDTTHTAPGTYQYHMSYKMVNASSAATAEYYTGQTNMTLVELA